MNLYIGNVFQKHIKLAILEQIANERGFIMSPKGGDRGGRRPLKLEGDPRDPFSCRIRRSNVEWLKHERERTGKSAGEIIDHLIDTHGPKNLLPDQIKVVEEGI